MPDMNEDLDRPSGRVSSSDEQSTAAAPPMATDEMGNEIEAFVVWYCHTSCIPAGMHPSIDVSDKREYAERSATSRRADAATWACVYVTGPHTHYRPKKSAIAAGPRLGTAADLGLEALP